MVALNVERTGLAFVGIQCPAGDACDLLSINRLHTISHDGYRPSDERDIKRFPFARRTRQLRFGASRP